MIFEVIQSILPQYLNVTDGLSRTDRQTDDLPGQFRAVRSIAR